MNSRLYDGANESGKSSLLEALTTLLYGFDPSRRELHPLAKWPGCESLDLHLEGTFEIEGGEEMHVERVLGSQVVIIGVGPQMPVRGAFDELHVHPDPVIKVCDPSLDDFADAGTDDAANRAALGID